MPGIGQGVPHPGAQAQAHGGYPPCGSLSSKSWGSRVPAPARRGRACTWEPMLGTGRAGSQGDHMDSKTRDQP